MDNQHRKISGYRELSEEEIGLMNEIKEEAAKFGEFFKENNVEDEDGFQERGDALDALIEKLRANESLDRKWVEAGEELLDTALGVTINQDFDKSVTEMQLGFMALVRSVAQPTTF